MIERLRNLDTEATPGPWHGTTIGTHSQRDAAGRAYEAVMARRIEGVELSDLSWVRTEGDNWLNIACVGNGAKGPENAAYIAALRNAAPKLYAVVEAAAEVVRTADARDPDPLSSRWQSDEQEKAAVVAGATLRAALRALDDQP